MQCQSVPPTLRGGWQKQPHANQFPGSKTHLPFNSLPSPSCPPTLNLRRAPGAPPSPLRRLFWGGAKGLPVPQSLLGRMRPPVAGDRDAGGEH